MKRHRRVLQRNLFDEYNEDTTDTSICGRTGLLFRDYQTEIVKSFWDLLIDQRHKSAMVVAATGLGKTFVAGLQAREWIEQKHFLTHGLSHRVLFLVHLAGLVHQTAREFRLVLPKTCIEIEQAENYARVLPTGEGPADVVCACTKTLSKPNRFKRYSPDHFGLIIVDECHHYTKSNKTYTNIIEYFKKAKVAMYTATPDRDDGLAMGNVCESAIPKVYDIVWGKNNGWLVNVKSCLTACISVDLADCALGDDGDFNEEEIARRMKQEQPLVGLVMKTIEVATKDLRFDEEPRQAIVFAASVEHAAMMAEIFNREHERNGTGRAAVIYSRAKGMIPMSPTEQAEIKKKYREGYYTYLCNYGVLTEGYDSPNTKIVSIGRLTKSRMLYAQMAGRGTRLDPAIVALINATSCPEERKRIIAASRKPYMTIVDPVGITGIHDLHLTAVDVLAGRIDPTVATIANDILKSPSTGARDVDTILLQARKEKLRLEEEKRKSLLYKVEMTEREIDPFDALDICVPREPGWFKGKLATEGQIRFLERNGFDSKSLDSLSFHKAKVAIDTIVARRNSGKCTPAQAGVLARFGYPTDKTFAEASAIIDELAKSGWKNKPECENVEN